MFSLSRLIKMKMLIGLHVEFGSSGLRGAGRGDKIEKLVVLLFL